jgi:hypothetical protein
MTDHNKLLTCVLPLFHNGGMKRIERSYLFHRLISALVFSKRQVSGNLSKAQIYELCDMVCDEICTESVMVVGASVKGFSHAGLGKFGHDEPWPDWCDPHGLKRDFGLESASDGQLTLDKAATS